ncbi:alpha/beta fold hydrolase [Rhizobium sp. KVB221]|uniref:Alpha/beta fold hydrolase n=1 Tax=Rhizobium setariae TaxID=2801340 RepID=A0A936YVK7_9HYPH|nr:alpha/beta hydrolase [Rhizobium setariae]MBL0373770.1 alpha/beta fold hydrolase [Rhizobium setariae]
MTTETWIEIQQGRLFAKCWGTGIETGARAPILLFHDSLGSVQLWRDFPRHLAHATSRQVIAYDRLGFGKSDPRSDRLTLDFIQEEAKAIIPALQDQLGFDRFVAFGHSVGGGMAIAAASSHPASCQALVTESGQAFVEDRTLEGIREAKRAFAMPGQIDRLKKYHGDKAEWVLNAWTETWLSPQFADWSLDAELSAVLCPVLAIHGDKDEFGSIEHPRRIAAAVAGPATVEILADCGHVPHREKENDVLDKVAAFLS